MMLDGRSLAFGTLFLAVQASACVANPGDEERTASATSAATSVDASYYYLACNATGWQLNDSTRMHFEEGAYRISYDVTQPWMAVNGDQCAIVQTHTLDGYDASTTIFGAPSPLVIPGGADLESGRGFAVPYPGLGRYNATLQNTNTVPFISIVPAGPIASVNPCDLPSYYYLTCNATGFQLNDSTRMHAYQCVLDSDRPEDIKEAFELTYDVTAPWMVTSGDQCAIVQTHTLDSYDACTTTFAAAVQAPVPGTVDLPPSQEQTFGVRYPALGRYSSVLMPRANGVVSVSIVPASN